MQPPLFYLIDTSTTEIYTLSLHDALPISAGDRPAHRLAPDTVLTRAGPRPRGRRPARADRRRDRKSTRLNSSHVAISYAVFCLKKKIIKKVLEDVSSQ